MPKLLRARKQATSCCRELQFVRPVTGAAPIPPIRAGYGNDILALSKQPCQGKLSGRRAFLFSNRLQACHQVQILPEVFPLKARGIPPVIVWSKILEPFDLPGQESAS